jgi:ascorbate-specific PTS system EIIC-type component UlaA
MRELLALFIIHEPQIIASVVTLITDVLGRQRTWFSIASTIMFTFGFLIFSMGSLIYIIMDAPGESELCTDDCISSHFGY